LSSNEVKKRTCRINAVLCHATFGASFENSFEIRQKTTRLGLGFERRLSMPMALCAAATSARLFAMS